MNTEIIKSGWFLIDKAVGPTSHDNIAYLRKITGIKKIGHAGTLDPFASGLLVVAVGRECTKKISEYVGLDKIYLARLELGAVSNTYDVAGDINRNYRGKPKTEKQIINIIQDFVGIIEQIPPMFSAKKIKGVKLYKLARQGIEIERKPISINIISLKILRYKWPNLDLQIHCSSGTYIRSLGHDIGRELGCGAYVKTLKRVSIGKFRLDYAVGVDEITKANWQDKILAKL